MYLQFTSPVGCENIQEVLDHVTTMCPINKHSVFFEFPKERVFVDGAHCGHMIQYFLNILTTDWAGKLQIHYSVYSERTQYILIQESVGILDIEPPCTKHILAQYRGVCPQC
jgi:hypothetical protein